MDLLYSLFFGAGVAGLAYVKMGRRVGYDNAKSVWMFVILAFFIATFVAYSLMAWVLNIH